jgi:CspA family cold shock protein
VQANRRTRSLAGTQAAAFRPFRSLEQEFEMATGTVKWFNTQKGYGFIQPSDGSRDVFVHITALQKANITNLVEGQRVTYELITERGKTSAGNLQVG